MFAEVIVRQRTNVESLTYAIPAHIIPYIRVGVVVKVPLRRRLVEGVVINISRRVDPKLKGKLKEIATVSKQAQGFAPNQISAIEKLADYYGASLAEVAYHALAFPSNLTTGESSLKTANRPTFLQAPWPDRKQFYLDLVEKYATHRRLVFIFGLKLYGESLAKELKSRDVFFDGLKADRRKKLQERLDAAQPFIAVGGQSWAFVPLRPGDLIIIDQPDHIGLRSERRPYMHVRKIAEVRSTLEKIQLIMASDLLKVEDFPKRTQNIWRVIEKRLEVKELSILDRHRSNFLLLPSLVEELLEDVGSKKKVLIFDATLGYSAALYCRNCQEVLNCPRCGRPIGLSDKERLFCRYCQYQAQKPSKCPRGHDALLTLGEGVAQLKTALAKVIPAEKIAEVSSREAIKPKAQVVVATEKILSWPELQFDTMYIAAADRLLSGSDPDGPWHLLAILLALRWRATQITIQTRFPDHWVWTALGSGEFETFYSNELIERQKYHLPPFGDEIRLIGADASRQRLEKQTKGLIGKLEQDFPNLSIAPSKADYKPPRWRVQVPLYQAKHFSVKEKAAIRAFLPFSWALLLD